MKDNNFNLKGITEQDSFVNKKEFLDGDSFYDTCIPLFSIPISTKQQLKPRI